MSKLNHYVIVGNHDYFNLECTDHSLQILKELNNVKVIDSYQEYQGIGFIPYIHDQDKLKKTIKNIKSGVLFGHLELKGFDFGNGFICPKGMTGKSFTKFKRVVSGHFHKFQQKSNLTYLGTPFSHSFGESNQDKFIGVYDVGTDNLELIESGFPKHLTIEVDCNSKADLKYEEANHFVRMILNGSQDSINMWRSVNELPQSYKVIERPTDEFQKGVQIDETLDNQVKFNTWAKDIKGLDDETIQLGMDILEAVK